MTESSNECKSMNPQLHNTSPEFEAFFNLCMRAAIPSLLILKKSDMLFGGGLGLSLMYLMEYSSSCLLNPMLGQTILRMNWTYSMDFGAVKSVVATRYA